MSDTNNFYTSKDMEESMVPLRDPEMQKRFLAQFQHQQGYPEPSSDSKQVQEIDMVLCHFKKRVGEIPWKLPKGAVELAAKDRAFGNALIDAYVKKNYSIVKGKIAPRHCDYCKGTETVTMVKFTEVFQHNLVRVCTSFACRDAVCHIQIEGILYQAIFGKSKEFTVNDMIESMIPFEDVNLQRRFMASFYPMQGYPEPTLESKQVVHVEVLVKRKETLIGKETWKFPNGVWLQQETETFGPSLWKAYFLKQGSVLEELEMDTTTCDYCSHPTGQEMYFAATECSVPFAKLVIRIVNVCHHPACQLKPSTFMIKRIQKADKVAACDELGHCVYCRKAEQPGEERFLHCGHCKAKMYCSKACQTVDWKRGHNKECKEFVRDKEAAEGAKRGGSSVVAHQGPTETTSIITGFIGNENNRLMELNNRNLLGQRGQAYQQPFDVPNSFVGDHDDVPVLLGTTKSPSISGTDATTSTSLVGNDDYDPFQALLDQTGLWTDKIFRYVGPGHFMFVAGVSKRLKELYQDYFTELKGKEIPMVKNRVCPWDEVLLKRNDAKLQPAIYSNTFFGAVFSNISCTRYYFRNPISQRKFQFHVVEYLRLAAKAGNLDSLKAAMNEFGDLYLAPEYVCYGAAYGGHLDVLKWALGYGFPWTDWSAYFAALRGHLELLEYARGKGCSLLPFACDGAARGGQMVVLKWARRNGFPFNGACSSAAEGGHLHVLKWALLNGDVWSATTCSSAARGGHLGLLQWARRNGCPWDSLTTMNAAEGGNVDVLKWVTENGCPRHSNTCSTAAYHGKLEALKYAHENGYPWSKSVCAKAAYQGHLAVLQWAHENGCPWDETTTTGAAKRGHLEILQWARGEGCPWDETTCEEAAKGGYLEVLRWAVENGCPWDNVACWKAALYHSHEEIHDWMEENGYDDNVD
jgi:MYND finger